MENTRRGPVFVAGATAFFAVWAMISRLAAPRRIAAFVVGLAAFFAVWTMINYIIAQIGSGSPELAMYHNAFRVGVSAVAGVAGAALVLGKR